MRWDELFDDLEGQLEQELEAERVDLRAEEERLRLGRLSLRDRVLALCSDASGRHELELTLRDGTALRLRPVSSGRDWIVGELLDSGRTRRSCLVPLDSLASVIPRGEQLAVSLGARGLGDPDGPGAGLGGRLGLAFALRDLCRRRLAVEVRTPWALLHGTIDRVARDHLDLAEHDAGELRRLGAVRRTRLLPFAELLSVRF